MQPHLVRWQDAYPDLVIVYVADGRHTTPERVQQVMQADGARFPIAYDPRGATTDRFGVHAFPTAFVIGRDGHVAWQGVPHFNPPLTEREIRSALGR